MSKTWKIAVGSTIGMLFVFSIWFYPVIRGHNRFVQFGNEIKIGQVCSEVRALAENIGYAHVVEWKDKNHEEYHFQNFMLTSVIVVFYDDTYQVSQLITDR